MRWNWQAGAATAAAVGGGALLLTTGGIIPMQAIASVWPALGVALLVASAMWFQQTSRRILVGLSLAGIPAVAALVAFYNLPQMSWTLVPFGWLAIAVTTLSAAASVRIDARLGLLAVPAAIVLLLTPAAYCEGGQAHCYVRLGHWLPIAGMLASLATPKMAVPLAPAALASAAVALYGAIEAQWLLGIAGAAGALLSTYLAAPGPRALAIGIAAPICLPLHWSYVWEGAQGDWTSQPFWEGPWVVVLPAALLSLAGLGGVWGNRRGKRSAQQGHP